MDFKPLAPPRPLGFTTPEVSDDKHEAATPTVRYKGPSGSFMVGIDGSRPLFLTDRILGSTGVVKVIFGVFSLLSITYVGFS